jgi:hypothetical protein
MLATHRQALMNAMDVLVSDRLGLASFHKSLVGFCLLNQIWVFVRQAVMGVYCVPLRLSAVVKPSQFMGIKIFSNPLRASLC